jgi:hypothetical protein
LKVLTACAGTRSSLETTWFGGLWRAPPVGGRGSALEPPAEAT